eukprot:362783-Chlamydomonas_euryale.AAC.19
MRSLRIRATIPTGACTLPHIVQSILRTAVCWCSMPAQHVPTLILFHNVLGTATGSSVGEGGAAHLGPPLYPQTCHLG